MLRKAKIVCTIGWIDDAKLKGTIQEFIKAGMDIARINMAHYDLDNSNDKGYLEKLISTIRDIAHKMGRTVAIMGDIQGPKVRIKGFIGKSQIEDRFPLEGIDEFILTSEEQLPEGKIGATIKYEGNFRFFDVIRNNVKRDKEGKPFPIEFWFADGKVILAATTRDITSNSARCKVVATGDLKKGQGITMKNSTIMPGIYSLPYYPKDRKDVDFLLEKEVDLFALSFVNSVKDVRNLKQYIELRIENLKLKTIPERFCGMEEFPIISKIETEEGLKRISEIIEESYGIMVARGDLALRAGMRPIGIFQKQIIDRCVTKGKPVITATQMLLSMMDFIEPRRSEVTDITNAIFDGTDALMLSEETADRSSKFPIESIRMMAEIALTTEEEIKRLNELEYKYKLDHRHEKSIACLREESSKLEDERRGGKITAAEYEMRKRKFEKKEIADHISYNACKIAYELKCSAIIVLTDTGGTARTISRFKPDIPLIAGVYDDQIARILQVNYGVESFQVKPSRTKYPIKEFDQVIGKAKRNGLLKEGDLVILVAGYPHKVPGTITFLNVNRIVSKVEQITEGIKATT